MAKIKTRINVTFSENENSIILAIAKQRHQSVASLVRELSLEALERQEDIFFSNLAEEREQNNNDKRIKHDDIWK